MYKKTPTGVDISSGEGDRTIILRLGFVTPPPKVGSSVRKRHHPRLRSVTGRIPESEEVIFYPYRWTVTATNTSKRFPCTISGVELYHSRSSEVRHTGAGFGLLGRPSLAHPFLTLASVRRRDTGCEFGYSLVLRFGRNKIQGILHHRDFYLRVTTLLILYRSF